MIPTRISCGIITGIAVNMSDFFKKYWKKLYRFVVLPSANQRYIRRPALFESIVSADPAKLFVVTVAFNDLELITLHHAALSKYLRDPNEYFLFDNSSDEGQSEKIKAFCLDHKINYVRLPMNRYRTTLPSASYSFALNWIYRNYIQRFKPTVFGIWDCDLFLVRPITILPYLAVNDTWGIIRKQNPVFRPWESGLHVWVGLAFFRFLKFKRHAPNFMPRFGVDIGGRIELDPKVAAAFPDPYYLDTLPLVEIAPQVQVQRTDRFVHFGASFFHSRALEIKKRWMENILGISKK